MFTAIIYTYFRPALLREAVGALRGQTYENLEIILVNDGGTPETREYLDEVAALDNRVKLVHFEENQWDPDDPYRDSVICLNAGLQAATGDYVWYQMDDDILADDYVEKMVSLFTGNPECTTAAGITSSIGLDGQILDTRPRTTNFRSRYMPGHILSLDFARGGRTIFAAPGYIFTIKRDALVNAGGYPAVTELSQLYGIVPFGVTGFDETAVLYWRRHEGQANKRLSANGWMAIDETFAMLKDWDIERRWQVFGAEMAKELVSRAEQQMCDTAAFWFMVLLYGRKPRACFRVLSKIWTHQHFWVKAALYATTGHPLRRWLRPVARVAFRVVPALAKLSPRLTRLRDRVNRELA